MKLGQSVDHHASAVKGLSAIKRSREGSGLHSSQLVGWWWVGLVESVLGKDQVLSKRVKLYLCQRYSGKRLKEIGERFGIGESGVSQARRRIRGQIVKDKRIRKMLRDLEEALSLSKV